MKCLSFVQALGILALSLVPFSYLTAQGTWTQKANFGGGSADKVADFSIGNKGYFGGSIPDLWEYDPLNDTWTQKASFIGSVRISAAGFSIGTKGYLGTGGSLNDFYEWDQVTNTWTQKANFGGSGREGAIAFATATKGYIGTGGNYLADMWEYDPVLDTWTQMASLPAAGRYHAGAFCINDKGYVCTGFNGNFLNDMWEYDIIANSWTQKSNVPGPPRDRSASFSIGSKGYLGLGWDGNTPLTDFYEWDQATNTWTPAATFSGPGRYDAGAFAIGSKGYVGTGYVSGPSADFWEFGGACGVSTSAQATSCGTACDGSATVTLPDPGAVAVYSWNTVPVQTTQTATGLCATMYTITVTDTNGCSSSVGVTVPQPVPVTATATTVEPVCFGDSTGSLCGIAAGGSGTYNGWLWSNGQTTTCATGLAAGTYTVTVTDSTGCPGSSTFTLNQPNQMVANVTHMDASCPICPDGNATANIAGGNGPYTFSWSNGVTNSAFISNLLPGTYICCITDSAGCVACDSTVVSSPNLIGNNPLQSSLSSIPNPFDDFILVEYEGDAMQVNCELFDITGRVYFSGKFPGTVRNHINTAGLDAGIYFLKVCSASNTAVVKLIKN